MLAIVQMLLEGKSREAAGEGVTGKIIWRSRAERASEQASKQHRRWGPVLVVHVLVVVAARPQLVGQSVSVFVSGGRGRWMAEGRIDMGTSRTRTPTRIRRKKQLSRQGREARCKFALVLQLPLASPRAGIAVDGGGRQGT